MLNKICKIIFLIFSITIIFPSNIAMATILRPDIQVADPYSSESLGNITFPTSTVFLSQLKKTWKKNPTNNLIQHLFSKNQNDASKSPTLSPEEIKYLLKDRPGLSIPIGSTKITANTIIKGYDDIQLYTFIINHRQQETLGRLAIFLGAFIGNLIHPISLLLIIFCVIFYRKKM